jgi:hypothetical protein
MKPDRYEASPAGRRRLTGQLQRRGARMGLLSWAGFLFGAALVGVGTFIVLVGTKVVPVDLASVRVPYWVLTAAGASFGLGGLMIWGMAAKQFAANRQRLNAVRKYPDEPALADYRWHPDGFEDSPWAGAAKAVAFAIGFTVFLSMFNWWAFGAGGPWMLKGLVVLFDACGLVLWWQAARQIGCALKFGRSKIAFTQFPYRLPEPVVIRWLPSGGISQINKGAFTLHCVEEWMQVTTSGRKRSVELIQEEVWSGKWLLEKPRKLQVKDAVELCYELPRSARPTQLGADRPVFWELEVNLDLPGLDFKQTYLVPIYNSKATAGPKPTSSSC